MTLKYDAFLNFSPSNAIKKTKSRATNLSCNQLWFDNDNNASTVLYISHQHRRSISENKSITTVFNNRYASELHHLRNKYIERVYDVSIGLKINCIEPDATVNI